MSFILWVIAAILVIAGIIQCAQKQWVWGIALIILGLFVGPGGVSLFT